MTIKTALQYGRYGLTVEIPASKVTLLEPQYIAGLADEAAEFRAAVRHPIGARPISELIGTQDRVAVVIPDITRPFPSDRVLPWLLEELPHVPADHLTIHLGNGSHRLETPDEIVALVGRGIAAGYRIVNHNACDRDSLELAGHMPDGRPVYMDTDYVRADRRIVLGFIEPHFMAGFSGGYKGIFPGVADIDAILHYHRASIIGDPRSTWGMLEDNPTQELIRHNGSLLPVDFCINVTLNRQRQITRFFCGDPIAAHEAGCRFARATAMVACPHPYPIVITTNSGYPLDQNLYQTVKGMSAGAQIVADGGLIITASECCDGFPAHGNYRKLLFEHPSPKAILDTILAPGFLLYDQWEAQKHAEILLKARVALYSTIPADDARRAHLEPIDDLDDFIAGEVRRLGPDAEVAVLPEGPMTIPYLANGGRATRL
ncbi:MAG TPA: nickel-dependent lactate racemase [Anaerolineae bacterium]|nr:nickel-dependent lactate racemase [Anaerolineae bacterium]